jgi:hypothetical protein
LVIDTTIDLPHEINIKTFIVEDAFSNFDITMKSNNFIAITLDDLNKCGNVDPEIVVFFNFMPFDDKHDGHMCI